MFNKKTYSELEKENRELKESITQLENSYKYLSLSNHLWNEIIYIAASRGVIDLNAQSYIYRVHTKMLNVINEETE